MSATTTWPHAACSISLAHSSSGHSVVRVVGNVGTDGTRHLSEVLQLLIDAQSPVITIDFSRAFLTDAVADGPMLRQAHTRQRAGHRYLFVTGTDSAWRD